MLQTPLHTLRLLPRYREIVRVLVKHGFGELVDQLGLLPYLSLPRRLFYPHLEPGPGPHVRLRMALEELGPTFVKLGQLLSTRPDLLPPAYVTELSRLQDSVPPSPWDEVKALLEEEFGARLDEVFKEFESSPLAAASLAQVHVARLPDGQEVIVKVQRPNVRQTIDVDLEILFDLARLLQERTQLGEIYDVVEIAADFAFTIRNELDYRMEGRNADRFRRNFEGERYLYIPHIYWEYTTGRVLTMERIHGIKIDDVDALREAGHDTYQLALNATRIIFKEILEDGFFHGDPHPGNLLVMEGGMIGALDFGIVGSLSLADRQNLVRLTMLAIQDDPEGMVEQLIRMGVADYRTDRDKLQRALGRILSKYRSIPLGEVRAADLLSDLMPLAFKYRLKTPAEFWLLGKTLSIMEGIGQKLAPEMDVFEVARPYIRKLTLKGLMPESWGRSFMRTTEEWAYLVTLLPRVATRILSQTERGELQFVIRPHDMEGILSRLNRLASRLAMAIILGALAVGMALTLPLLTSQYPDLALIMLIAQVLGTILVGAAFLANMWGRK